VLVEGQTGKSQQTSSPSTGPKAKSPAKKHKAIKAKTTPVAAKGKRPQSQPPLWEVVIDVLKRSRSPLRTKEIADRVLATDYKTASKDFSAVVQDLLGKLDSV
jgi:hypothetical protein